MALTVQPQPYGLRDIKVATLDATGTKGTLVDLPASQTLEFSEKTAEKSMRGDDVIIAKRVSIDSIDWTMEAGGISFEASVVMFGGTITSSGVTPAQVKTYTRLYTDSYPDFYAIGQAMSETGGDMHLCLFRNKANQMTGTLQDQEFWVTHAEGSALPSLNATDLNKAWAFIQHETAIAVA